MRVVDANVLIYAVNEEATHHGDSHRWLEGALGGGDTVGFSWIALTAFIRLSTKPEIFPAPLPVTDAMEQVRDWIDSPNARVLNPTERHHGILTGMLTDLGTGGNLVNDAHLAALAMEHRATIVSYDNDFSRFSGVRWYRPLDLL